MYYPKQHTWQKRSVAMGSPRKQEMHQKAQTTICHHKWVNYQPFRGEAYVCCANAGCGIRRDDYETYVPSGVYTSPKTMTFDKFNDLVKSVSRDGMAAHTPPPKKAAEEQSTFDATRYMTLPTVLPVNTNNDPVQHCWIELPGGMYVWGNYENSTAEVTGPTSYGTTSFDLEDYWSFKVDDEFLKIHGKLQPGWTKYAKS